LSEREKIKRERTAALEDHLFRLALGGKTPDGADLAPAKWEADQINAAYKLHTIYNGLPVAPTRDETPPDSAAEASRARIQADLYRMLADFARPEPLRIEATAERAAEPGARPDDPPPPDKW
jgi:hypothetical protein